MGKGWAAMAAATARDLAVARSSSASWEEEEGWRRVGVYGEWPSPRLATPVKYLDVVSTDGCFWGKLEGVTGPFTPIHVKVGTPTPLLLRLFVSPNGPDRAASTAERARTSIIITIIRALERVSSLRFPEPRGLVPSYWRSCAEAVPKKAQDDVDMPIIMPVAMTMKMDAAVVMMNAVSGGVAPLRGLVDMMPLTEPSPPRTSMAETKTGTE